MSPERRTLRIGYALALGLCMASQAALWVGNRGKVFRDHLQPLPLAGLVLVIVVWIYGGKINGETKPSPAK